MENQNSIYLYNDEIDLKVYVRTILNRWIWIVLASLLAGGLAFVYIAIQTDVYISTALVSISAPSLDVEFDTSIRTTNGVPNNFLLSEDLSTLALSDEVVLNLFNQVQPSLPEGIRTHFDLKSRLSALIETRSGIIELSGKFNDPELSALIVNEWSELFVQSANLFFEGSQEDSQQFLVKQLATAREERDAINSEVIAFQSRNTLALVETQLEADKNLQGNYIDKRNRLEVLLYDIRGLKRQIEQNPNDPNVLSELALFTLQNRAFGTSSGNIQLQISSFDNLSTSTIDDRIASLNILEATVQTHHAETEGLIVGIEPLILLRQQQIQELSIEETELNSRRKIIQDTYNTLALKVAESDIEQNNTSGKAQIASRAIAPVRAESRNQIANSVLASMTAAMLSMGIILIHAWWVDDGKRPQNAQEVSGTLTSQNSPSFSNGNDYSIRPVHGNGHGNGAHPTEKEEFPAND